MMYSWFSTGAILSIAILTCNCDLSDIPALIRITEPVTHGECPSWDPRTQSLLYVDIPAGRIYRYNYASNDTSSIHVNGAVAPVVQSKADPNLLIVGLNRSIAAVRWEAIVTTTEILATVSDSSPNCAMNDGKADKEGRIWFGTMNGAGASKNGKLYKVSRDNVHEPEVMIAPVDVSNGMAWNRDNDRFYYIDSDTRKVFGYDYENKAGIIANRSVVFDLEEAGIEDGAVPDGMTIDNGDNLWIALWGGGSVIQVNPRKRELLMRIAIPATYVTSVMWGGPKLDMLFVTTSRRDLSEEERKRQPGAGSVFALTNLGTKGVPVFEADIIDSL